MSRLLVFGSRSWSTTPKGKRPTVDETSKADFERILLWDVLDTDGPRPSVVIEGEAIGADQCARRWAKARGVEVDPYPVDISKDGDWPAAGHRRNARMHRDGKPDRAVGFISGKVGSPMSKGSAGMLAICRRAGTPVIVYREDGVDSLHIVTDIDLHVGNWRSADRADEDPCQSDAAQKRQRAAWRAAEKTSAPSSATVAK